MAEVHKAEARAEEGGSPLLERVLVLPCADAADRPGLVDVLRRAPDLEVLPAALPSTLEFRMQRDRPDAAVIFTEDFAAGVWTSGTVLCEIFATVPVLLLARHPAAVRRRAAHLGIRSLLPLDATATQIVAAIRAVVAGLQVGLPEPLNDVERGEWPSADAELGTERTEPEHLTARETEVLRLIALGHGNKQVAARLGISEHTAKFHVHSILAKLGAASRTEAVTLGILHGLVAI